MKRVGYIVIMAALFCLPFVPSVAAQGANETWFTINMTGLNASLLIIGMGGIDYSRQIINTEITTIPEVPVVCYALAPTNLMAWEAGPASINLTWTKATCANGTMVRGSQDGWPGGPADGFLVYSGNDTTTVMDGFAYDLTACYIRAWGYNDNGYSADYISLRVGHAIGAPAVVFVIGLIGLALWRKNWIRLLLAICLVIWGAFTLGYDVKIAGPLIAVGSVLAIQGLLDMKKTGLTEI